MNAGLFSHSSFPVRCALFFIRHSLFAVRCFSFVIPCSLCAVFHSSFPVRCALFFILKDHGCQVIEIVAVSAPAFADGQIAYWF
jgi:hypothetical protein